MKRILNLNSFSLPALVAIATTGAGVPVVLFLLSRLMQWLGRPEPILLVHLARVLAATGGILLLLFFALVILEQVQDHWLYRRYMHERGKQVEEECPFCGNRQLRSFERYCPVCGEKIRSERD